MDDDPWISWKMAQTDDELHESGQSHGKAERSDCDTKGYADPVNVFFFLFFFGRGRIWWCSGEAKACRVSTLAKRPAN